MGPKYLQSVPIQRGPDINVVVFKALTIQTNHQQLPISQCRCVLWPSLTPDIVDNHVWLEYQPTGLGLEAFPLSHLTGSNPLKAVGVE